MKRQFAITFVLLLALGLGSSVTLAQGVNYSSSTSQSSPASPVLTPATSPTPTPSESPALIVTVNPTSTNTIDPIWVFLAGALIGAALLSLAEVSGVSYVKKHGKGPQK